MPQNELLVRRSRALSEARRDREMLLWIARFRFVTAEVLADRFDVSHQRVNARLRRLERAGLVVLHRDEPTQPRAVYVSGRGARRLGLRVRRAPRPDAHREHERALAAVVARLERLDPSLRVLTERDARAREADSGDRHSADVRQASGELRRRLPDLVIEHPTAGRVAVEVEFAAKHTERLRRIVAGYINARWFAQVRILVGEPAVERRIAALAAGAQPPPALTALLDGRTPDVLVEPWYGPHAAAGALRAAASLGAS